MESQPVTRTIIDHHVLASSLLVEHVEVRRISIARGVMPGAHWHNGPVFGVIERGSVFFQVDGDAERVLRAGDTFFEPADTTIARFDATDEGVTFLAWFPMASGVEPELTMRPLPGTAT
jgi:quercetin dioxygenase-like cupin family protein